MFRQFQSPFASKPRYFAWLYNGSMVSPWLSGGFNSVCRWIYENRPDIADDCILVEAISL